MIEKKKLSKKQKKWIRGNILPYNKVIYDKNKVCIILSSEK